jgi:hypothetical protein
MNDRTNVITKTQLITLTQIQSYPQMSGLNEKNQYTQRLEAFLSAKNISVYRLSVILGAHQTRVKRAFDKRHGLDSDLLNLLSHHFPDLNIDWVVTGRGDMLLSTDVLDTLVLNEPFATYGARPPVKLVTRHEYVKYVQYRQDNAYLRKLPNSDYIQYPGTFRDFEIVGNQLQTPDGDGIEDGDILRAQFITPDLYSKILRPGMLVVIITRKEIYIQPIQTLTDKEIILHSWNPQYPSTTIPTSTIQELWSYHQLTTRRDFKHLPIT